MFDLNHFFNANRTSHEKGQGLVEYALILVLVSIVVIVILAVLGPEISAKYCEIITAVWGECTAAQGEEEEEESSASTGCSAIDGHTGVYPGGGTFSALEYSAGEKVTIRVINYDGGATSYTFTDRHPSPEVNLSGGFANLGSPVSYTIPSDGIYQFGWNPNIFDAGFEVELSCTP